MVAVNGDSAGAEESTAPPDEIGFVRERDAGTSFGSNGCGYSAAGECGSEEGSVAGDGITECRREIGGTEISSDRDDAVSIGRQIGFFGDLKGAFVQCPNVFVTATVDSFCDLHCFC